LNAIPLGSGANGIQAAAQTYFQRSAWRLTVAQAAMIAAMIQSPSGYDPLDPTANAGDLGNSLLDRWVYVLSNMVRDGAITQATFNTLVPNPQDPNSALKNFPKVRINSPESSWPGYRGYIMQLVANELAAHYGMAKYTISELGNLGLKIRTTISEPLMNALYSAIAHEKQLMASMGVPLPSYVHIAAVLEKPGTGRIEAFYGGPGYGVKHCSIYHCDVDTILQAEPVGSSFKPYVLATAVNEGMDVQNSILNSHSPLCIPPDYTYTYQRQLSKQTTNCDQLLGYWPFNEPSENYGVNLGVPAATALSNDPAYLDLIHRTTVGAVISMAQTLGVSEYDVKGLWNLFGSNCRQRNPGCFPDAQTAALGEGSLSAVDQANTFSVLVSDGKLVTPHVIGSVYQSGVGRLFGNGIVRDQALRPAVAADTDYALRFDTSCLPEGCGTGVPNAVWDRPMIAKTGTIGALYNSSQAWFVAAIPQFSLSVGLFTDRPNGRTPQILDGLPTLGPWTGGYGGAWRRSGVISWVSSSTTSRSYSCRTRTSPGSSSGYRHCRSRRRRSASCPARAITTTSSALPRRARASARAIPTRRVRRARIHLVRRVRTRRVRRARLVRRTRPVRRAARPGRSSSNSPCGRAGLGRAVPAAQDLLG
jgi:membrane peptidoglycan carboxypeptidase